MIYSRRNNTYKEYERTVVYVITRSSRNWWESSLHSVSSYCKFQFVTICDFQRGCPEGLHSGFEDPPGAATFLFPITEWKGEGGGGGR